MKTIYISILNKYLEIPLVQKTQKFDFQSLTENTLDNFISDKVVPGIITFYSQCITEGKNYMNLINDIIILLKQSPKHLKMFHSLLKEIEGKKKSLKKTHIS